MRKLIILFGYLKQKSNFFIQALWESLNEYIAIFKDSKGLSLTVWISVIYIFAIMFIQLICIKKSIILFLSALLTIFFFCFTAGYLIYLIFVYLPNKLLIRKSTIEIRERLELIFNNNEFYKVTFKGENKVNPKSYIAMELVPESNEVALWLYRLKVARNSFILLAPLGYFFLAVLSFMFSNPEFDCIKQLFHKFINVFNANIIDVVKWGFSTFVITNEVLNLNKDISKVELLKDLNKDNSS